MEEQGSAEVFGLIEDANLILITGMTGSGKSALIFSYFDHLAQKYDTDSWAIHAYDIVMVDYADSETVMPFVEQRHRHPMRTYEKALHDDIELVTKRAKGEVDRTKKLTIHITECDLFMNELQELTLELFNLVAQEGKRANVQLIYETSRPGGQAMLPEVMNAADLKIMTPVASEDNAAYFIQTPCPLPQQQGEMAIHVKGEQAIRWYDLYLPRSFN